MGAAETQVDTPPCRGTAGLMKNNAAARASIRRTKDRDRTMFSTEYECFVYVLSVTVGLQPLSHRDSGLPCTVLVICSTAGESRVALYRWHRRIINRHSYFWPNLICVSTIRPPSER